MDSGSTETAEISTHAKYTGTITLESLQHARKSAPTIKDLNKEATLKIMHKYGPYSPFKYRDEPEIESSLYSPTFVKDEHRVNFIRSTYKNSDEYNSRNDNLDHYMIPIKSHKKTGPYLVSVGLGSPKQELFFNFDTGSDFTWTRCKPGPNTAYGSFNPSNSTSYETVTCPSPLCSHLISGGEIAAECKDSKCSYFHQYLDVSYSGGVIGRERLTLTPDNILDDFIFGCSQEHQTNISSIFPGMLGLGRGNISLMTQIKKKFRDRFSYCLPLDASHTGYLQFGKVSSTSITYTKLVTVPDQKNSIHYGLDIVGISVGGHKLPIEETTFSKAGMIIDSGTTVTWLQPTVYKALREEFRSRMANYTRTKEWGKLETCYKVTNEKIQVPLIRFHFKDGGGITIPTIGTVIVIKNNKEFCLVFRTNDDDRQVAIFGSMQQKKLEIIHDIGQGLIGFGADGCLN